MSDVVQDYQRHSSNQEQSIDEEHRQQSKPLKPSTETP